MNITRKPKPQSLYKASKALGKSDAYLAAVKANSRDKFDYIMSLDEDYVKAYRKYEQEVYELVTEVGEYFSQLENKEAYKVMRGAGMDADYQRLQDLNVALYSSRDLAGISFTYIKKIRKLRDYIGGEVNA